MRLRIRGTSSLVKSSFDSVCECSVQSIERGRRGDEEWKVYHSSTLHLMRSERSACVL